MDDMIVIDTPRGRVGVVSGKHLADDEGYMLDQRAAMGALYNPTIHGPPHKLIVPDAKAFVQRLKDAYQESDNGDSDGHRSGRRDLFGLGRMGAL